MLSEEELIAGWAEQELLAAVRAAQEARPDHLARGRFYLDLLNEGLDGGAWAGKQAADGAEQPSD